MGKGKIRLQTGNTPPSEWVLGLHIQIPLQRVAWALNQIPGLNLALFNRSDPSYDINDQFVMENEAELQLLLTDNAWLQRKKPVRELNKSPFNAFIICPDAGAIPVSTQEIHSHLQSISGISLVAPFENTSLILNILSS